MNESSYFIMDSFAKQKELDYVYKTVPDDVRKTIANAQPSEEPSTDFANAIGFVSNFVKNRTAGDLEDITSSMKKNFPLTTIKPTKSVKRNRHRKNLLTSIEKRKLGLQNLPKNLKYKSFTKLHKAWQTYIEGFLNLDVSTSTPNQDMLHTHLAKADYTGCLLMVTRSKCPSYIGVKGIVILETKNTLKIICPDDQLRTIPKRDSVFMFIIRKWTFTLFGNHLNIRPSERASRKFRSRVTIDL